MNNNPFLIHLNQCFMSQTRIFFIMDYINGRDLYQNLAKVGSFSENQTKFIIAQLVLALKDLHHRDILHRDLKAKNVLMKESGYVVLSDFGISKIVDRDNPATTYCGTREYMAPEILKRK
jgi:serine/threonine protein kinase